jgi:hypothetical protein
MTENIVRHRRVGALVAGALGVVALSLTAATTLGGFSAALSAPGTENSGTLVIALDNGSVWCDSTGANGVVPLTVGAGGSTAVNSNACSAAIDAFGGATNVVPAGTVTTQTLTVKNLGTIAGTGLTLTPGACAATARTDTNGYHGGGVATYCGKVNVTIQEGASKCLFPVQASACPALANTSNLGNLGTSGITLNTTGALAAAGTDTLTIKTQLDTSATNVHQGLKASVPFTWSISQ